ncbi:MAG: tetratricopeptide repeat protein [Proteobacteria bacterium]|nr:tetratricopeptide repeat protein [Pseudomonadota bacterium]MBS0493035.1 tetratricopeptide repeat protein [Pseudomonadota bacterium]
MLKDRYGLPLSTPSTVARDAYVAGVDDLISGVAGYRGHLDAALAADPGFALAQVALARGLFMDGDFPAARQHAGLARALALQAGPREQSHVNVICLPLEGQPAQALAAMHEHLGTWPNDAMVLAPATSVFGLYGFSGRLQREEQLYALLSSLAAHYGDDWWFDMVLGFAACETGRLDEAQRLLERSLQARPHNGHAVHFRAHVMYERGESTALLDLLQAFLPTLDKRSLTHCHLSWHLALALLAVGERDRAWAAYRDGVHPGGAWGPPINVVTDATSFLWRAELAGEPRAAAPWGEVHAHALHCYPSAGIAYADTHTLIACVANDDLVSLHRLLGEVRQRIADDRYPPGEVVPLIAEGFLAYSKGDWSGAIRCLRQAVPETVRIGGSRAQRDLVEWTLCAALIKADRPEEARQLLARCAERRPLALVAGLT